MILKELLLHPMACNTAMLTRFLKWQDVEKCCSIENPFHTSLACYLVLVTQYIDTMNNKVMSMSGQAQHVTNTKPQSRLSPATSKA